MKNAPVRHALEYAAYSTLRSFLRALPHSGARRFGRALGRVAHALDARHRQVARRSLAFAFPELEPAEIHRLARESFAHFGAAFCDSISSLRFDRVAFCERLTIAGWEHLEDAEADGHGALVMSAHLGFWEAAAQPVGLYRGDFHVVGRPADNPHLDRELARLRERFGVGSIEKRGAARRMLRVLEGGGHVGLMIDQRVLPREGIEVPFFGRPAWTSPVLAKISMRTGAPVVPIYGWGAADGRYQLAFRPPIRPDASALSQPEEARVRELTTLYLASVEAEIRRAPAEWLWLHDRWKGEAA